MIFLWKRQTVTCPSAGTGELELARDQHLSPVFHFDPDTNKPYGAWVIDPARPYLDCRAGDIAHYHAPTIDYDAEAEFISGPPDGAQARFRPSQWGFVECGGGEGKIGVERVYGTDTTIWSNTAPEDPENGKPSQTDWIAIWDSKRRDLACCGDQSSRHMPGASSRFDRCTRWDSAMCMVRSFLDQMASCCC